MKLFRLLLTTCLLFAFVMAFSVSAGNSVQVLHTFDSTDGCWGTNIALVTEDAKEGSGYVKASDASCPVICNASFSTNDISAYVENGCVRFWFYVDHADQLQKFDSNWAQFQLQTNGNDEAYVWDFTAVALVDGWNDVTLSFKDTIRNGNPANVNALWVWNYVTADTVIAIDNLRLEVETEDQPADPGENAGTSDVLFALLPLTVLSAAGIAVCVRRRRH